jgi:ketosteroid isomerase-like protein
MSQENIDAVKRFADANNRRDVGAMLAELDVAVEWHDAAPMLLGGEATVFRGHEGFRDLMRDLWEVLAETQVEFTEIRDLGDRIVATGELRTRGKSSGVETESPYGVVSDFENGRVIRIRTFLDHQATLQAAGLHP